MRLQAGEDSGEISLHNICAHLGEEVVVCELLELQDEAERLRAEHHRIAACNESRKGR